MMKISTLGDMMVRALIMMVRTDEISADFLRPILDCTTYDEAIKTLQTVFVKPVNEIFARHQLSTRKQQPGESVDQFLQFLKLLSRDCGFKAFSATVYAQESIRDAFISGLSSSVIRQRLLEKHTLTLDEAMQLHSETYVTQVVPPAPTACFVGSETSYSGDTCTAGSDGEVRITDASTTSAAVTEDGKRCYFCGRSVHSRLKCLARRQTCLKCGKVGHFANVCRSSNKRNIDNASAISMAALTVTVNGEKVNALIDSGSDISILDSKKAQKLLLPIIPSKDHVTMAQSSLVSNSEGHCLVDLIVKGNLYQTLKFSLLSNLCAEAILGRDFMKLHRSVEFAFSGSKPKLTVCGMTCMNLNPPTLFSNLPSDCRPYATSFAL
ncbi:hypothetical protein Pmani_006786 [Petrolisthes manimaculis]|uniref:CCHC-type domain-containing protein n=1 Tax=Petrolisthes manimaculis TaxID=1843537 RepID=A0AAE1UJ96_9EUCA|nr:hypothetical protein Pmani_006786 [Petrolisthes manimaculis]